MTPTEPISVDPTQAQPTSTARRHRWTTKYPSEESFQDLRSHIARISLALLLALPVGMLAFFAVAAVRFGLDDRTFWSSQSRSIVQFWYVLVGFVVVAAPAAFVLLRSGRTAFVVFVIDRGYWKVPAIAYAFVPLVGGIIIFVAGHLIAVLIVLALLLVLLATTGGF